MNEDFVSKTIEKQSADAHFMARCIELAQHGRYTTAPNPMVGAVVVCDDKIVGEGWHHKYGGPHAEVEAMRDFDARHGTDEEARALLRRATVYVSLEPCSHWGKTPPCADMLAERGVRRVVVGCTDPNVKVSGQGIQRLRDAGIEVEVGVLETECRWLNRKFMMYHTQHRPWVTLKWAESQDGFIGRLPAEGEQPERVIFSTPWTRMMVHQLRATHQAILVGRRTDELDQPALTTRYWTGPSPRRIVLSHGRYPSLQTLMDELYADGIQSLLVEGGAQTLQSFLDADLWDEIFVERSHRILNDGVKAPQVLTDAKGRPVHVNFT